MNKGAKRAMEVVEEPDILELAHISEPELRDSLEMEELDILESAYTSEPEVQDSGSPQSLELGMLLPGRPSRKYLM